ANAVVVPVNPMNRAQELQHYLTDPQAQVAITTSDLASELAEASNGLPQAQGLRHLIVARFLDAFDPAVGEADAPPDSWRMWLAADHAPPQLVGGQVRPWSEALAEAGDAPEHVVGRDDLAVLPYTSGTTG